MVRYFSAIKKQVSMAILYGAQPKAIWAGLICRTYQYYATSDCQNNYG